MEPYSPNPKTPIDRPTPAGALRKAWFGTVIGLASIFWFLAAMVVYAVTRSPDAVHRHVVRNWARTIFLGTRVTVTVAGLEKLERDVPYLYLPTHHGQLDFFALMAFLTRDWRVVGKSTIKKYPLGGWVGAMVGHVFVEREDPSEARKGMQEILEVLARGRGIVLFPEGGLKKMKALQPFKRGAFIIARKAMVPMVPIVIVDEVYRPPNKGRYTIHPRSVHITICDPVLPEKGETSRALIRRVRAPIVDLWPYDDADPDATAAAEPRKAAGNA